MKLLSDRQIRLCDQYTIEQEGITSVELMERAAKSCYQWMQNHLPLAHEIVVICGAGNNGGDGLALARLLHQNGSSVRVLLVEAERYSNDNQLNQQRLREINLNPEKAEATAIAAIAPGSLIVDALLGTGFTAPLRSEIEGLIEAASARRDCLKLSLDLPSGFSGEVPVSFAFQADLTLCFQRPRLQFFFAENEQYLGRWELLDIGLQLPDFEADAINQEPLQLQNAHFVSLKEVRQLLRKPSRFAHKGSMGRALLVGGADGKTGALTLAVESCLRSGVGLTWAYCTPDAERSLQVLAPEAQTIRSGYPHFPGGTLNTESFQSVGFGPGSGTAHETASLLKLLIQNANQPLVLDADALNILAEHKTWMAFLPSQTLLTPHPGEFDRLTEKHSKGWNRLCSAIELSQKTGATIVLKGAYSSVVCPDGSLFFNSTGNPGMATAGSGDVLTGLLTGLAAQGYSSRDAAIIGVYLHGLAGDLASAALSENALKAGDLIAFLPEAWKRLIPG